MKIEQNYESQISDWMLAASTMDVIRNTFLDNGSPESKKLDAFYNLMKALNRWNNEIKKMPK